MKERYINQHTDFGFKRLFGSESNKELLISFLNTLFAGKQDIKDVIYLNTERLGERIASRRSFFDVCCETKDGENFIVEMQNGYQECCTDRTIYYSTFLIREQAQKEEWDFHLNGVYIVGLLNFIFEDEGEDAERTQHEVKLMDVDTKKVLYGKLTKLYVEIPKFKKTESELVTMYDKWMFVLKNLSRLRERPAALQDRVFTRLFEQAEIAKFNAQELKAYEECMDAYRDIVNAINTEGKIKYAEGIEAGRAEAIAQAMAKGIEKINIDVAKRMLGNGEPIDKIMLYTGLSKEEIEKLG